MKATFDRDSITRVFSMAATVAPVRSPKEVLTYAKLSASEGDAVVSATDMESSVVSSVPCECQSPGSILLPVQRFASILRECSSETLDLSSDGNSVSVHGTGFRFNLPTPPPDEFPSIASPNPADASFTVPCSDLVGALQRTVFCTDGTSGRYALEGIQIEESEGGVYFVGTDGRRLSCVFVETKANGFAGQILPGKAAKFIIRILAKSQGDAVVTVDTNWIDVFCDGTSFRSRTLEGRFPNWRQVMPTFDVPAMEASFESLSSAIRQVSVVSCDEDRGVDMSFSNGLLRMKHASADIGEANVELPVNYQGDDANIMMDHEFVSAFLRLYSGEELCSVQFVESRDPVLFSVDGHRYVVMPMAKQ